MFPLFVSIGLVLGFPLYGSKIKSIVKKQLTYQGATEDQIREVMDYVNYVGDLSQIIFAIILSIATIVVLPFFTHNLEVSLPIIIALVVILSLTITYFGEEGNPYTNAMLKIGPYGWAGLASVALNILIIILTGLNPSKDLSQLYVFRLP